MSSLLPPTSGVGWDRRRMVGTGAGEWPSCDLGGSPSDILTSRQVSGKGGRLPAFVTREVGDAVRGRGPDVRFCCIGIPSSA